MAIGDINSIIRKWLSACTTLIALIGTADPRIYCPRLEENATLPAVSFKVIGGDSTPYIPGIVEPLVEFDCWANNLEDAREVYRALYDNLQGIQGRTGWLSFPLIWPVVWGHRLLSAIEENRGADLVDTDIQNRFRKRTTFRIMVRGE